VYAAHDVNDDPNIPTTAEIFVVNVDGSGVPVQLTHNTSEERAPAWSPDGSKIVFMCRYGGTDFEICTINPDGSGLVQVTNNTVQELSIRWSVDGTQFWFNRPVSGGNQLFKINADGTGETQMTNTVGHNLFPAPGWLRVHTDCRHPSALPAQAPLATAGFYDLLFLDANTRLEVTTEPFGSPVILHAHIEDSTNNAANRGSVVFQYCSLKGRPPNDIDRVDEAPLEECEAGNANWALLANVPVDEFGNAEWVFCCPMITPTIGFRFTYQPQGSGIAKHTIDPENFNWRP
jgi:WD40-like Beta Propeller Repeat